MDRAAGSSGRVPKNILITGRPGVGKTTLIRGVLARLEVEAGGFYTQEMREGGRRVGFSIFDLRGESGVLAHVGIEGPIRVGRYTVNREDLERIGVPAVEAAIRASPLIVMDEVGRMELCSEAFLQVVVRALDCPTPVLATIQDRANPFLDRIKDRSDAEVHRLTVANRGRLQAVLSEHLVRLTSRGAPG